MASESEAVWVAAMRVFRKRRARAIAGGSRFLRQVKWQASLRSDSESSSRFQKAMKGGIPESGTLLLSLASEKEEVGPPFPKGDATRFLQFPFPAGQIGR